MAQTKPVTMAGQEVSSVYGVDFRTLHEVFDIHGDERELLDPGLILKCCLKLHWYTSESTRSQLVHLRAEYDGQQIVVPTPTSKYNPRKTVETSLPVFDMSVSDDDFNSRQIGAAAIAYLKSNQSPMIHNIDGSRFDATVATEALGIETGSSIKPHFDLLNMEGVAYSFRPSDE